MSNLSVMKNSTHPTSEASDRQYCFLEGYCSAVRIACGAGIDIYVRSRTDIAAISADAGSSKSAGAQRGHASVTAPF
jgi:hypothetical protein